MLKRRTFLSQTITTSAIAMTAASGLLIPVRVLGGWNKAAFEATDLQTAIKAATGTDITEVSGKVHLEVPDNPENGATVHVTVTSTLKNVDSIMIFSEKNTFPMIANFKLGQSNQAFVSTRVKMGETSNLVAIVRANGEYYMARKHVKITVGGCGL